MRGSLLEQLSHTRLLRIVKDAIYFVPVDLLVYSLLRLRCVLPYTFLSYSVLVGVELVAYLFLGAHSYFIFFARLVSRETALLLGSIFFLVYFFDLRLF